MKQELWQEKPRLLCLDNIQELGVVVYCIDTVVYLVRRTWF